MQENAPILVFAPFVASTMRVEPAWIDYNGHMNMAYYVVVFDGEMYGHWSEAPIPTPTILDNLIAQSKVPPTLAVLVDGARRAGAAARRLHLVTASRVVSRPLEVTGADTLFDIHPDVASALVAVAPPAVARPPGGVGR